DAPVPFLLSELKEGPYTYGRLVAARSLHRRGRREGLAAMIAEWQGQRPKRQPKPGEKPTEVEGPEASLVSVAEFLAASGKAEVIQVLAKNLRKRSVHLRMAVVSLFGESERMTMVSSGGGGLLQPGEKSARDNPKAVRDAIEQLLVDELDDTEEQL